MDKVDARLAQQVMTSDRAGKLRLRVIWWKSANFTFIVTVRPKAPAFSH
jgi:hypothetical protein